MGLAAKRALRTIAATDVLLRGTCKSPTAQSIVPPPDVVTSEPASVGDQPSDLAGGYAEKTFLLPDPFYRIA